MYPVFPDIPTKAHFTRNFYEQVKFYGCRHVLLEEYDIIREELIKREYQTTESIAISIFR